MLKRYEAIYDHGHIKWLSEPPKAERFKMLVVVEQPEPAMVTEHKRRIPPPELKNSVQWLDDPFKPAFQEEESVASLDAYSPSSNLKK